MNQIETIPLFEKGVQYKELNPYTGGYKYRFVTLRNIEIFFINPLLPIGDIIEFSDEKNNIWLTITHKSIIISKNYAWDGCTPKIWWGVWWGTPDFECTRLASLVHDALLQFHRTQRFPLCRYEIDNIFKSILHQNKCSLKYLYYVGVRIGSGFPSKPNIKLQSALTTTTKY
jgi:hypothetical protein